GVGQFGATNTTSADDLPLTRRIVTKSSSDEEKHLLFLSLFAGRPDVHALRYQSSKSSGYTPHCYHRFKPNCPKQRNGKAKCSECDSQRFPEITLELFMAHIHGKCHDCKDVLGAYPLDADDLCTFIVADFDDKHNGEGDNESEPATTFADMRTTAIGFFDTCLDNAIPAHLEVSRSGHGLHVWLFFAEPVSARLARRLFNSVLTAAMEKCPGFDLSKYDRFIPSQDIVPKGGFGNLVALPLQGKAGKARRSVFVDDELRMYADQWEYLSRAKKFSATDLNAALLRFPADADLGKLVPNEEETIGKPWERKRATAPLSRADFLAPVSITFANMLHVEKRGLSPRALNHIRRLAAFKNPVFFEHQRMRISNWNTPQIISTADETEEYLSIPRGAYDELIGLLEEAGVEYEIEDIRTPGQALDVEFLQALREDQVPAAEAMLKYQTGVLHATTGFGKTVIGNYLIAQRRVNTLILVGTQQLFDQWKEALGFCLSIKNEPATRKTPKGRIKTIGTIGEYGSGKKHCSFIVDVAMMQSLCRQHEVQDFVKDYGMVIVDECHHVPASTFEAVLKHVNARYVYGLTATPMREDGHHAILFLECGLIRYRVDAKAQAENRPFDHFMVPRFTSLLPASLHDGKQIPIILNDIMADEQRNKMLLQDIVSAINDGRQPLVLTERTEHVRILAEALSESCDNVIALTGAMGKRLKREINDRLSALQDNERFVLIATGKYIGEGFDFPRLDTLFITMPIAAKSKVTQYIGRLHRLYHGKKDVLVYDYVDVNVPVLERMYHKRIKSYKAGGYKVLNEKAGVQAPGFIFDADNYWEAFANDCSNAKAQIAIASPSVSQKKVSLLLRALQPVGLSACIITLMTKPIGSYAQRHQRNAIEQSERLRTYGIRVDEIEGLHKSFAVIDLKTVWYGNLHTLGYDSSDSSVIRLEDEQLARALLEDTTPAMTYVPVGFGAPHSGQNLP
ncbi:MAG: DEAD/DEAH box helicase family protein, partial [Coriobacteriales bacterium]|nr:DEAD/DEAH box helicase family protein [Coriobacteriales bacterium]